MIADPRECLPDRAGRHEVDRATIVRTDLRVRIFTVDIALHEGMCRHCRSHLVGLIAGKVTDGRKPRLVRERWMSWSQSGCGNLDDLAYARKHTRASLE